MSPTSVGRYQGVLSIDTLAWVERFLEPEMRHFGYEFATKRVVSPAGFRNLTSATRYERRLTAGWLDWRMHTGSPPDLPGEAMQRVKRRTKVVLARIPALRDVRIRSGPSLIRRHEWGSRRDRALAESLLER